jgi:transposase
MNHYVGLDVSVKETSLCIVDERGTICRELKVTSHPDDLIDVLKDPAWQLVRIGLETGPLSQWLFEGLARAGLPVVCIETRHTKAFLTASVNKTDRNDARGIAQMMRVNLVSARACQNGVQSATACLAYSTQANIEQG